MVQVKEQDLQSILLNLPKEKVISILLDLADEDPNIEKRLLFQFAENQDEIASSKKLIKEYIRKAKDRGFIPWNRVNYALQGAEMVLQKAEEKITLGETEAAVSLGIVVLANAIDMLQFADDSNGSVGDIIRNSYYVIDHAIDTNFDNLDAAKQKKLFQMIVKEASHKRYNDWSESRVELLKVCVYFCNNNDLRAKLESQVDSLMEHADRDYEMKELKLLQLGIIEQCEDQESAEKFIYENIHISDFREKAIECEMEKGNYEKVISLCLEGESEKKWPGLVKQWKKYRFQAYEHLGNVEKQREIAKELLFDDDFKFYAKLKELYPVAEWKDVLNGILEELPKRSWSNTYLSIILEERLTEHILEYCNKNKSYITDLYPYLIKHYPEEVNRLFIKYILEAAEEASDRKKYKNVCQIIKTYKQVCGADHAERLIYELKEEYKRRPAFLEELGKIK